MSSKSPTKKISPSKDLVTKKVNFLKNRSKLTPKEDTTEDEEGWVLPNKTVFPKWVSNKFKKYSSNTHKDLYKKTEQEACFSKDNVFQLFPHQMFIRDYLHKDTPYRGLLLYHGLGVGKTCSSIAVAEILLNFKKVVVILPASLKANYIQELRKCGNDMYNNMSEWMFFSEKDHKNVDEFHKELNFIPKKIIEKNKAGPMTEE